MKITTMQSIALFKPALLAGVMGVGLLPVVGHATTAIGNDFNTTCGTTVFTGDNCSLCHSGEPSASNATIPDCPTVEPDPVAPPDPVEPPPDPVEPPPDPVEPPPDPTPDPDPEPTPDPVPHGCTDKDHDGFAKQGGRCGPRDCRDKNRHINPGAKEICDDGKDNNCNGLVDLADKKACRKPVRCVDADDDGYSTGGHGCGPKDCDDGNWLVNPGEKEFCRDGIDNDCDGKIDHKDSACRVKDRDRDRDRHGDDDDDDDDDGNEDAERSRDRDRDRDSQDDDD